MLSRNPVWGTEPVEPSVAPGDCWALRRGRPHTSAGDKDLRCTHAGQPAAACSLCVPMTAQGDTLGLLHLRADALHALEPRLELAVAVSEHLALSLANFRLRETLQHQSIRDPLTNLYNRRYMEESLEREVRRAGRHQLSLAVVSLDIDHFKTFNDTHGHEAGDTLLVALGDYLHAHVRAEDVACRPGGEEFLVILPYATLDEATTRARQLCEGIRQLGVLPRGAATEQSVTVSLGVAAFPDHADNAANLLRAADAALYEAKRGGRDRVVVARPPGA